MMTLFRVRRAVVPCAVLALAGAVGCGINEQKPPSVTGPSEFGLSLTMGASPDQVTRDGTSQSLVTVTARNAEGLPVANQIIAVALVVPSPLGTSLSESEIVTGTDGRATVIVIAPPSTVAGDRIMLEVRPAGTSIEADSPRRFSIGVTPSNPSAPVAEFERFPADKPLVNQAVLFDASKSTDEGVPCGTRCTYTWDFGDSSATGITAVKAFSSVGNKVVKLTVRDEVGAESEVSRFLEVAPAPPPTLESVTFSPTPVNPTVVTAFDASTAKAGIGGTIEAFTWSWGDGKPNDATSGPQVNHSFDVVGKYTVTVTVRDNFGQTVTKSVVVDVVTP